MIEKKWNVHQCVGVAERPEKAPVEPSQRSKGELDEPPDALGAPLARRSNDSQQGRGNRKVATRRPAM